MNIEDRLDNWARAVRFRSRRGHAMSFEGNYRSPQRNHWELPAVPIPNGIDYDDAWKVEAAWATLPELDRIILRCHYCLKWASPHVCRIASKASHIRLIPSVYGDYLDAAIALLEGALCHSAIENRNLLRSWVKKVLYFVPTLAYNHD